MSEQKNTEEKQLTYGQLVAKSPVSWSMGLIKSFIDKNPGIMQTAQAQRCAMSAVSKVIGFLQEQGYTWDDVDINHLSRIFIRLAIYGLDAESGDWYAYSRKNSKTGLQQFDPNPSYSGERKLRIKYSIGSFGKIKDIQALTIREGDKLTIKKDLFGKVTEVEYNPIPFNKAKVIGYLGITLFEDGTTTVKEFSPEKIEEYHKANPNKSPAWDKWYEEMATAKVIKHTSRDYLFALPDNAKDALTAMDIEDIDKNAEANEATEAIDITPPEPLALPEKEEAHDSVQAPAEPAKASEQHSKTKMPPATAQAVQTPAAAAEQIGIEMPDVLK
jgi:hypothetical protein